MDEELVERDLDPLVLQGGLGLDPTGIDDVAPTTAGVRDEADDEPVPEIAGPVKHRLDALALRQRYLPLEAGGSLVVADRAKIGHDLLRRPLRQDPIVFVHRCQSVF
ncbi:hypothetical protein ACIQW5_18530 [Methylorubrum thiocyanatum]|uniref:hypothetical protein n=1 Tax=Methylorubrum thiocyanatum TaxID=47958 RepID=UPI00383BE1E9